MTIYYAHSLREIVCPEKQVALTIGTFDGVHLGHTHVLERLKKTRLQTAVLTFSNHPAHVLRGEAPPLLTSADHKLSLLTAFGIHALYVLPFTSELSKLSAGDFLQDLQEQLPFTQLVLGHDAMIGHNRDGTPDELRSLASTMHFSLSYLEPVIFENQVISSSLVRSHIEKGELEKAAALLGRPYSIYGTVCRGEGIGANLGFPTANISTRGLCLPPRGVWRCSVVHNGTAHEAIANLGCAPTLHSNRDTMLEVHLIDQKIDLYKEAVEVIFCDFIREERTFSTKEELQKQMAYDLLRIKSSRVPSK